MKLSSWLRRKSLYAVGVWHPSSNIFIPAAHMSYNAVPASLISVYLIYLKFSRTDTKIERNGEQALPDQ